MDLRRYVAGSFGVNVLLDRLLLFERFLFFAGGEGRGGIDIYIWETSCLKTEDSEGKILKKKRHFSYLTYLKFFFARTVCCSLSLSHALLPPPSSNQIKITDRQNLSLSLSFSSPVPAILLTKHPHPLPT